MCEQVTPFFSHPEPIRKAIYTTNAIESLNSSLRRVMRKHGAFPTDDSVRKVLYLVIRQRSKKWTMPINNWPAALNFFSIVFEGRVPAWMCRDRLHSFVDTLIYPSGRPPSRSRRQASAARIACNRATAASTSSFTTQ